MIKKSRMNTGRKEQDEYRDKRDEEKESDKGENITFQGEKGITRKKRKRNRGTQEEWKEESIKIGLMREGNHLTVHFNIISVTT